MVCKTAGTGSIPVRVSRRIMQPPHLPDETGMAKERHVKGGHRQVGDRAAGRWPSGLVQGLRSSKAEHPTLNRGVVGSNPTWGTIHQRYQEGGCRSWTIGLAWKATRGDTHGGSNPSPPSIDALEASGMDEDPGLNPGIARRRSRVRFSCLQPSVQTVRSGAVAARGAHNPEVAGSTPASATKVQCFCGVRGSTLA